MSLGEPSPEPGEQPALLRASLPHLAPLQSPHLEFICDGFTYTPELATELAAVPVAGGTRPDGGRVVGGWRRVSVQSLVWPAGAAPAVALPRSRWLGVETPLNDETLAGLLQCVAVGLYDLCVTTVELQTSPQQAQQGGAQQTQQGPAVTQEAQQGVSQQGGADTQQAQKGGEDTQQAQKGGTVMQQAQQGEVQQAQQGIKLPWTRIVVYDKTEIKAWLKQAPLLGPHLHWQMSILQLDIDYEVSFVRTHTHTHVQTHTRARARA